MRLWVAIVLGLVLGGALAWWLARAPAQRTEAVRGDTRPADKAGQAGGRLYRWRDARGVLQVTDRPPADRPYEIVDIPYDRNIVPMTPPGSDEGKDD